MKKKFICFVALFATLAMWLVSCEKEAPEEKIADTIVGSWKISQATASYRLLGKTETEKTPLNNETLQAIFGSTTFTFDDYDTTVGSGKMSTNGKETGTYTISEDGKYLTMYIAGKVPFTNEIKSLTKKQMELSLTAAVPVLGLDISASVSLILNRQ